MRSIMRMEVMADMNSRASTNISPYLRGIFILGRSIRIDKTH